MTKKNPKDHVKAVTLRNGRELQEASKKNDSLIGVKDFELHEVQVEEPSKAGSTHVPSETKGK